MTLKNILFQLHWLLGISAGIVLAVVGVSGAMLSFEDDILRSINAGVMTVEPRADPPLTPVELLARVRAAHPDRTVTMLTVSSETDRAVRLSFAPPPGAATGGGRGPRGETRFADPYTAELLGQPRGQEFFRLTMQIHRWLAAGDVGKQIVGASTVALVYLCLSGLYLRWPRKTLDWRAWLTLDLARKGRSFLWGLHSLIGTWVLLLYLLAGLTGLYWSYEGYRDFLYWATGATRPNAPGRAPASDDAASDPAEVSEPDIAAAWATFQDVTDDRFSTATLRIPERPGQPLQISYQDLDPPHERATNTLILDPVSGTVRQHRRYADLPVGQQIMTSILPLHSGSFFGRTGLILMMLASLGMPLFVVTGWMLYLDRRRKRRAAHAAARGVGLPRGDSADGNVLVAFASQSGTAEQLAWQTAGLLRSGGLSVAVEPLARISTAQLAGVDRAMFVVSTFGEGEPPDEARSFMRTVMGQTTALAHLSYGLLAMGDRRFAEFCGFGRALDGWLRRQGARALFDRVEADDADAGALRHWQHHLRRLAGTTDQPDWAPPPYEQWRLVERRLLNPGCPWPTYHIALVAADPARAQWTAGDIAEIGPRHAADRITDFTAAAGLEGDALVTVNGGGERLADLLARSLLPQPDDIAGLSPQAAADRLEPLPHREYSIASIPEDGRLHLLVRQMRDTDSRLGLGSGWLTEFARIDDPVALRIRRNPSFHPPADDRPLILIGNGTGLAGLRAHLKQRACLSHRRNWLIFGERHGAHDFYYRDEIERWQAEGLLERLDLAFSRDQAERIYVQRRLRDAAPAVRGWIAAGAAVYVCGSLQGMAPGVEEALVALVGTERLEQMAKDGRYRRDVY
ncbi:MAG: PepSY domain-containing protein [Dongiaceae bacterium]